MLELTFLFAILVGISLVAGYPVYFIYSRVISSVRSNKYGNTGTPMMDNRTGKQKFIDRIIWVISGFIVLWLIIHWGFHFGSFSGRSFETYQKHAYLGFFYFDLPSGAEDFRYRYRNFGLAGTSVCAFTLQGSEYEDFLDSIDELSGGKVVGYHDDLDYTGMKVSETTDIQDDNGKYIGFPCNQIKNVIDDDINDYTILYYYGYDGTKNVIHAIAVKPDTGRFVIFSHANN